MLKITEISLKTHFRKQGGHNLRIAKALPSENPFEDIKKAGISNEVSHCDFLKKLCFFDAFLLSFA